MVHLNHIQHLQDITMKLINLNRTLKDFPPNWYEVGYVFKIHKQDSTHFTYKLPYKEYAYEAPKTNFY